MTRFRTRRCIHGVRGGDTREYLCQVNPTARNQRRALKREPAPLAFQAGHAGSIPVTRSTEKPLHSKVFHAHGRPVLLKRRSCVPSVAVCTTPVPRRHDGDHPGALAMAVRSRART